jgi:hypothetical protein
VLSSISSSRVVVAWPLRVAAATVAILVAYNLAIAVVNPDIVLNFDAGLRNQIVAERYLDEAPPRAVLTGSSMGFRLSVDFMEGDYLGPQIYNLSFAGKTALPGLDLILAKPALPRLVLVEMNTMDRGYDREAAADSLREPWRRLRAALPGFRIENRPLDLAIVLSWRALKSMLGSAAVNATERIYAAPAGLGERGPAIDDEVRFTIGENIRLLEQRIAALQSSGIRVVLVRLPSGPVEDNAKVHFMWDAVHARFGPGQYEWLDLSAGGPYQTDDGVHLTKSSARLVAAALRHFVERGT